MAGEGHCSVSLFWDVYFAVLEQLDDRRDLHAAALVCKALNRAAMPLLYRELDSDTRTYGKDFKQASSLDALDPGCLQVHPATTLLKRPQLARHVWYVHEAGALHTDHPQLTPAALEALCLCSNIRSFTWSDDRPSSPAVFERFLDILLRTNLRALTIRTYSDLGYRVWQKLNRMPGLTKVAVWCMDGPPQILEGWAPLLGGTLTELELGRCAGVPAGVLISVLAQLPRLRDLRLKGAPSSAMYHILACLPELVSLDTEYLGRTAVQNTDYSVTLPRLRRLTVRTSSVDLQGPKELWNWLQQLIPSTSLESFTLNAFSTQGYMTIPSRFLQTLAKIHSLTLQRFCVNQSQLALADLAFISIHFPLLEELSCAVTSSNAAAINGAIEAAQSLHTLKLHVSWMPNHPSAVRVYAPNSPAALFSKKDAEDLMLRRGSCIRKLSMGPQQYIGKWVPAVDERGKSILRFVVEEDPGVHDR
ncbi:hypothetical protein K488DRAFT_57685 [Vararia minispora EC-137]|uniref:Uncharacterized protein n=1 Tax=Vararia minispora EC-137 TaxID=1314806 RepID=A0ACB8QAU5_9AGAM|nr:hypothetical protein K488DRAFT_57685 [Vararia minispora EC-137]